MLIDEPTLRIVLTLLFVLDYGVQTYFRRRARLRRRQLPELLRGLCVPEQLFTFLMYCGLVTYLVHPAWMTWSQLPLPDTARALGIVPAALGLAGLTWAFRHLGANLAAGLGAGTGHSLVTTGPYRWIRHPLYSAWSVLLLGYSVITASLFVALCGLAALTAVVRRTPIEERALLSRFGGEHRKYAARTGRFVPRLRRSCGTTRVP